MSLIKSHRLVSAAGVLEVYHRQQRNGHLAYHRYNTTYTTITHVGISGALGSTTGILEVDAVPEVLLRGNCLVLALIEPDDLQAHLPCFTKIS